MIYSVFAREKLTGRGFSCGGVMEKWFESLSETTSKRQYLDKFISELREIFYFLFVELQSIIIISIFDLTSFIISFDFPKAHQDRLRNT